MAPLLTAHKVLNTTVAGEGVNCTFVELTFGDPAVAAMVIMLAPWIALTKSEWECRQSAAPNHAVGQSDTVCCMRWVKSPARAHCALGHRAGTT